MTISKKEVIHNNLEDKIYWYLKQNIYKGKRFYQVVGKEVPMYRPKGIDLYGKLDLFSVRVSKNGRHYYNLYEIKGNPHKRYKAHTQLNTGEEYLKRLLNKENITNYKIFKFFIYKTDTKWVTEWYKKGVIRTK